MKTRLLPFAILAMLLALAFFSSMPANPTQGQAYYYTPTPNADGVILYTVRDGETCGSIALKNMVDQGTMETLNGLTIDDCSPGATLIAGTTLILGTVTVPTESPATATPEGPTPTVSTGSGRVCVYLYHDANNNGIEEADEPPIAGGQVTILDAAGAGTSETPFTTLSDGESACSEDLAEGEYTLQLNLPDGYAATTSQEQTLQVSAGQTTVIRFGAVVTLLVDDPGSNDQGGGTSIIVVILGSVLLLAGIALGVLFFLFQRKK